MNDYNLGLLIADSLDLIGTLLIAYAALSVHHRFRHEHKVDEEVFQAMTREIKLGILGVFIIVAGFGLKLVLVIV